MSDAIMAWPTQPLAGRSLKTNVDSPSQSIAAALDELGWLVVPGFVPAEEALTLSRESLAAWEAGAFRRARVGRGEGMQLREDIRTDHVMWMEPGHLTASQQRYFDRLEDLRLAINARLFLGLFEFEGHVAVYPEGGFYRAHLDRHQQTRDRVVSVILYLNEGWQPGHGGELKLWTTPGHRDGHFESVEPRLGTLACFLSGDHWHEVLPATRPRVSITGWFRVRGN